MRSWTDRGGTWRQRTRAISRRAPKRPGTPIDERRRTRRRWGCDWERYGRCTDSVATPWEQPRGMLMAGAERSAAEGIGIDANLELSATVTITYDIEG